jgi:putative ABC transport system ATP-binding protein
MSALDQPTEGDVVFDGESLSKLSEAEKTKLRRESIGFVFQSVALIPIMSALENVDYALRIGAEK